MGALCVYLTNLQSRVSHTVPLKSLGLLFLTETHMSLPCIENIANIPIKGQYDVRNDGFNGNNVRKGVLKVGYQTHIILYSADSTLLGPVSIPIPQSKCYPQGMVWAWEPSSLAWYARL